MVKESGKRTEKGSVKGLPVRRSKTPKVENPKVEKNNYSPKVENLKVEILKPKVENLKVEILKVEKNKNCPKIFDLRTIIVLFDLRTVFVLFDLGTFRPSDRKRVKDYQSDNGISRGGGGLKPRPEEASAVSSPSSPNAQPKPPPPPFCFLRSQNSASHSSQLAQNGRMRVD
ncbi:hypothetical protein GPALN_005219 [Globodera pallida]|nr:hypothetical protein GPALN_005219 [Globodera pallida]